jgi:hypothetical protein
LSDQVILIYTVGVMAFRCCRRWQEAGSGG